MREKIAVGLVAGGVLAALAGCSSSSGGGGDAAPVASAVSLPSVSVSDTSWPLGRTLEGHTGPVLAVAFSPGGDLLASAGDHTVRLWTVPGGKLIRTIEQKTPVHSVAFAPEGDALVALGEDGLHVIKLKDASEAVSIPAKGYGSAVSFITSSLVAAAGGSQIGFWAVPSGKLVRKVAAENRNVFAFGDAVFAVGQPEDATSWWVPKTAAPELPGPLFLVGCLQASGNRLASGDAGGEDSLRVWSLDEKKLLFTVKGTERGVGCLALSGERLAAADRRGDDGAVRVYDASSGKLLALMEGHRGKVRSLAFARPDLLASGGEDRTVRLWSSDPSIFGPELHLSLKETSPEVTAPGRHIFVRFAVENVGRETARGVVARFEARAFSEDVVLPMGDLEPGAIAERTVLVTTPDLKDEHRRLETKLSIDAERGIVLAGNPAAFSFLVLPEPDYERRVSESGLAIEGAHLVTYDGDALDQVGAVGGGEIWLKLANHAGGPAIDPILEVAVAPSVPLRFPAKIDLADIAANGAVPVKIALEPMDGLTDGEVVVTLSARERRGLLSRPVELRIKTSKPRPPATFLVRKHARIYDGISGNNDGILQNGERAEVEATFENRGSVAAPCRLEARSSVQGVTIEPLALECPPVPPGGVVTRRFWITAGRSVDVNELRISVRAVLPDTNPVSTSVEVPFQMRRNLRGLVFSQDPPLRLAQGATFGFSARVLDEDGFEADAVTISAESPHGGIRVDVIPESGVVAKRAQIRTVGFRIWVSELCKTGATVVKFRARQAGCDDLPAEVKFVVVTSAEEQLATKPGGARPPVLTLQKPPRRTAGEAITIRGTAGGEHPITSIKVLRNGQEVEARDMRTAGETGSGHDVPFALDVPLTPGPNRLTVVAINARGLEERKQVEVERLAQEGRTFALIVGVGRFRNEGVIPAPGADADAKAFREVLAKGLPDEDVTCLVNEAATRQAILGALSAIRRRTREADKVLIWFGGRGFVDNAGVDLERCIAPYDLDPAPEALFATGVSLADVAAALSGTASEHILTVLDVSWSGGPLPDDQSLSRIFVTCPGRALLAARVGETGRGPLSRAVAGRLASGLASTDELLEAGKKALEASALPPPIWKADLLEPFWFSVAGRP